MLVRLVKRPLNDLKIGSIKIGKYEASQKHLYKTIQSTTLSADQQKTWYITITHLIHQQQEDQIEECWTEFSHEVQLDNETENFKQCQQLCWPYLHYIHYFQCQTRLAMKEDLISHRSTQTKIRRVESNAYAVCTN